MKLSDFKVSNVHKTIVYGAPKTGKTAAVGLLAKHYKLIYFDGEGGVSTLLNPAFKIPTENVEVIQTKDAPHFPIYAELCMEVVKWNKVNICEKHGKLKCAACIRESLPMTELDFSQLDSSYIIVFDSLTQLSNSILNMVKLARGVPASKLSETKSEWDDYGRQGAMLDTFLTCIQNAPFNVIVISHEQGIEQEDGSEKLQPIGGTRNFARQVPRYFDNVVRLEVKNRKHTGVSSTTASGKILAGSRTGAEVEKLDSTTDESLLRGIYTK